MTISSQNKTKQDKHQPFVKATLPDELQTVVSLKYDLGFLYDIKDEYTGETYRSDQLVQIQGTKYLPNENCVNNFITKAYEGTNNIQFDTKRMELLKLKTKLIGADLENSKFTDDKISLIDFLRKDPFEFTKFITKFLDKNRNYEVVGLIKLVKKSKRKVN